MSNVLRSTMLSGSRAMLTNISPRSTVLLPSMANSKRFTHIVKRKVKLNQQPKLISPLVVGPFLREPRYKEPRPVADFIYEDVEDTDELEEPKLKLILLKTVDELGVAGDLVEVEPNIARFQLLSSRAADYASEYNLNKYKQLIEEGAGKDRLGPSSAFVTQTIKRLANDVIVVVVNDRNPWTLSREHLHISLRSAGYSVPLKAIQLPKTEISGPDIEGKDGKDFAVQVTINNQERVWVRCMIQHKGEPIRLNWKRAPRFILLPEEQGKLLQDEMPVEDALEEDDYNN